jgi:hypothetical protein
MVQALGDQVIVGVVLIVVMMAVLGWVECRLWHGSPVQRPRREPVVARRPDQQFAEPVRCQRRPAPGRKTA